MFTVKRNLCGIYKANNIYRNYTCGTPKTKAVVLGVYDTPNGDQELSEAGKRLNEDSNGLLEELLRRQRISLGNAQVFSHVGIEDFTHIALAGLGTKSPCKLNHQEQLNEEKENIRVAMAVGAREVQDLGVAKILVDGVTVPEAAAEGSYLGTYKHNVHYTESQPEPVIELYDHPDKISWMSGEINAESQNWARYLSHLPSNLKEPTLLTNEIIDKLCKFDVRVDIRDQGWMLLKRMNAAVALTKRSCKAPILLEISYCGDDPRMQPITLVGKCSICDSGGLFLKSCKDINEFRADMAGAAACCATFMAVARKRLPINLKAAILIYENMPSPMGMKPGDIIIDKNGTSIRVSNPDKDCRIILGDIINFTEYYDPSLIIDVGTFARSVSEMLGVAASGVFTTDTHLFNEIQRAALETGDRVWRLPLWNVFSKMNRALLAFDIDNDGGDMEGDGCTAAAFLNEFTPKVTLKDGTFCAEHRTPFIHIDCFGTGLLDQTHEEVDPYYRKGIKMGRPTRLLIQFLYHRACIFQKKTYRRHFK